MKSVEAEGRQLQVQDSGGEPSRAAVANIIPNETNDRRALISIGAYGQAGGSFLSSLQPSTSSIGVITLGFLYSHDEIPQIPTRTHHL